jgi:hypothetical protein
MKTSNQNNRSRSVEKGSYRQDRDNTRYNNGDNENFDYNDDDYQRFLSSGRNNPGGYPDDFERDYYGYEDNFDPDDSYHERRESKSSGKVNRERRYSGNETNNYGASNNYGHGSNYNGNEYDAGDHYEHDNDWNREDDNYRPGHNHERGSWGGRLDLFYDEDTYDNIHEFNDEHTMDSGRNSVSKRYNHNSSGDQRNYRYQNENAGNTSDRELSGRTSRRSSRRNRRNW